MDKVDVGLRLERVVLAWLVRGVVAVAFTVAGLDLVGWATGVEVLTRILPWTLDMNRWTALLLVGLGVALLLQSGVRSPTRVWVGRCVAAVLGACAIWFLVDHAIGGSSSGSAPGSPAAASVLLLSITVMLIRVDRPWTRAVWSLCLATAVAIPIAAGLAHLGAVVPLADQAILSAVGLLMFTAAVVAARPDRFTVAWLLTSSERWAPVRLVSVFVVLPILVGLLRWALLKLGVGSDTERVLSIVVGVTIFAGIAFLILKRAQGMQFENEHLDSRRADAETHYRLLAENAVDVVAHLRGTQVIWISPSVVAAFGWPVDEWIGTDFSRRIFPEDVDTVAAGLQEVDRGGMTRGARVRTATADGSFHWVEARGKPYIDSEGNTDGMIVAIRIVDEHVEAQRQLDAQRQRFEAVVANSPSAISVCDLEYRYTLVNQAFCQLFGQKSVADVIGRTKDEILPPDARENSRLAVQRILAGERFSEEESVSVGRETFHVVTQQFPLRDSAGVVRELVTVRTDITHRKKAENAAAERSLWEQRIRAAISDERLVVYSQSIVDIATRTSVEEELLVRMRDSDTQAILLPAEFLPQCEQHGLMPEIDRYMVERAIELAHSGRHVCVNITGQTIRETTVLNEILAALTTAGPTIANRILFEITETTALASPEIAEEFSRSMSALGCRMALDDFGTGYGTFTELRHLDLDSLKIDQSFVQNMLHDRNDERVVNTIAFVARQYGLKTVAEGVETEQTLEKLAELGIDRAQGYFFGKPKPVNW